MDTENVLYTYDGILALKKEGSLANFENMDERRGSKIS